MDVGGGGMDGAVEDAAGSFYEEGVGMERIGMTGDEGQEEYEGCEEGRDVHFVDMACEQGKGVG